MTIEAPVTAVRDLTGLLARAAHVLNGRLTAALAEIDSSPRAHCVLLHALETERTQSQLAALADLDKTTMVVTVDELERRGLAERRRSSADRRAWIIAVTPAGADLVRRGAQIVDRVHAAALVSLPPGEGLAFVDALVRLVDGDLAGADTGAGTPESSGVRVAPRRPRKPRA